MGSYWSWRLGGWRVILWLLDGDFVNGAPSRVESIHKIGYLEALDGLVMALRGWL